MLDTYNDHSLNRNSPTYIMQPEEQDEYDGKSELEIANIVAGEYQDKYMLEKGKNKYLERQLNDLKSKVNTVMMYTESDSNDTISKAFIFNLLK